MTSTTGNSAPARPGSERFQELMEAGRHAQVMGNMREAHEYWKEAARLNPTHEPVWLALLEVITSDEDKLVCLQNILQINPLNVQARRQLHKLEALQQRRALYEVEKQAELTADRKRRRAVLRRAMLLGLAIGISGVIFGVVLSLVLYGG